MSSGRGANSSEYDLAKIDAAVLALLHLNSWTEQIGPRSTHLSETRAWKGFDWDALDRLHEAGLIGNPRSKARSISLTPEGSARAAEECRRLFGLDAHGG